MSSAETFVALSTPHGVSGIGVIRLSGSLCKEIAFALHPKELLSHRAYFAIYKNQAGEKIDEVLLTYFQGPKSYTGDDMLEISCHGNPLIQRKILDDLCARGCRPAEPGEFTRTAFLNQKLDLSQAESVLEVIHAQSEAALRLAQRQLGGEMASSLTRFFDTLLDILAEVEARIDFSEDTEEPYAATVLVEKLSMLHRDLCQLASSARYRSVVDQGIQTVIFGAPNVGKSSLLNALMGQERAIVSEIAGTTRDFIEESIPLGEWRLKIVDTAGVHEAQDPIESIGISRSLERLALADFVLWVLDQSQPLPEWQDALQKQVLSACRPKTGIIILNKNDLPAQFDRKLAEKKFGKYGLSDWPILSISTRNTGALEQLKSAMLAILRTKNIIPSECSLVVSLRQEEHLKQTSDALEKARQLLLQEAFPELVAAELRQALWHLQAVNGGEITEATLDRIFGKFCIGK